MKIFFALTLFSMAASAVELYQPGLPSRCLAMGGTCISQVRGAQALYLNPAALARVEGFDFIVAQVQAGVSKDAVNFSSQFNGSTFQASDLNKLYGKTLTADINARSGFVMPNFGMGAFSVNYTSMAFSDPTFPTFNMNFISDYGYILGGAYAIGPKTSVGASLRHIKRWGGNQDIDVSTLSGASAQTIASNNFKNHGVGHAVDLAFMTTWDSPMKPTFSMVWQDFGVTKFNMSSGVADPPSQYDNLILGLSLEQEYSVFKFSHAIEYKFATLHNEDMAKKIHLGTEASFGPLDLRAGINQGYITYGLGLDLWFFNIEAAAFATELGTYPGQQKSDRYNVSVTIEMDFDQTFKLQSADGKKRRLMQRR